MYNANAKVIVIVIVDVGGIFFLGSCVVFCEIWDPYF